MFGLDLGSIASFLGSSGILQFGSGNRSEYLADREHTEAREDSAVQRRVEDMRKAGLSPYTIGASAADSSASTVGANTVANRLQMLGYILDMQNLNLKNKKIVNDQIGDILGMFKFK